MSVTFSEPQVEGEVTARISNSKRVALEEKSNPGAAYSPKDIWDAAERGLPNFIIQSAARTVDFNANKQEPKTDRTALHYAAELGQMNCVQALMDLGADCSVVECMGRTPVHLAAREGYAEILKEMMDRLSFEERKVLANQGDNFSITPVFLSRQRGEDTLPAFEYLMTECDGEYNILKK